MRALCLLIAIATVACSSDDGDTPLSDGALPAGARDSSTPSPDSVLTADLGVGGAQPSGWVTLNAGSFKMGSPAKEPCRQAGEVQHDVTLTRKVLMQITETTQSQFKAQMGYNPATHASCANCPVEQVSWHEAAAYCNALSAAEGLGLCYACKGTGPQVSCEAGQGGAKTIYDCPGYRLPTEAEQENAIRAGTTTAFYNGPITSCQGKDPNADAIGWYKNNSSAETHPVAEKQPNAWGLHDLTGNVMEWGHDRVEKLTASPATDPWGTKNPAIKIHPLRGGSFTRGAEWMRSAFRGGMYGTIRTEHIGFRCAKTL